MDRWIFRGFAAHLDHAADRLRIRRIISDRLKHPPKPSAGRQVRPYPDIAQIGRFAAGLSLESIELAKRGQPVSDRRLAQIAADLAVLEESIQVYHVLAVAVAAIIDEVHIAYGFAPPDRPVRIECDH